MAPYNTPQAIRLLEKMICDFAYSNGYDPISVFNDFLLHGNIFQNRSSGERTVLYPAGYLRPDGLMYRFGGDSDRKTYL